MQFLTFRLHGPFASWGDVAVGSHRPSHEAPTRSAVVGLLAACKGIDRTEEDALRSLHDAVHLAVESRHAGSMLRDYHTAQTRPRRSGDRFYTRQEELSLPRHELTTILSEREYRTDVSYAVATWTRDARSPLLSELRAALLRPVFTPFLGRRSCPVGHPFAPMLVEAETIAEALAALPWDERFDGPRPRTALVWHDADPRCPHGLSPVDALERWDGVASFRRREFRPRPVERGHREVAA